MIALLYYPIYLLIVTIVTLNLRKVYANRNGLSSYSEAPGTTNSILYFAILLGIVIGIRPVQPVFGDMVNTVQSYNMLYQNTPFVFDFEAENFLYDNILALFGALDLGTEAFFTLMALIYYVGTFVGIRRMFPQNSKLAYFVFLAAFSTFSYSVNGVKAGSAAALFILALSYRNNLKVCIPLVLISWGFHHSMQLPVAAFFLTLFFKNPRLYFGAWCFCLLMAIAHVSAFQSLFASMSDSTGAGYLAGGTNDDVQMDQGGFRLDFIAYSAMPVLVGYYAIYKKKMHLSRFYSCLLNTYLCTNGVWMLCMYAQFTNRIAYLSWFLYPIVLIYPFLNEDWGPTRYKTLTKVFTYHLCFTLFMECVYYGSAFTFLKHL